MSFRKSIVWILLATVAEVPPVVSLAILFGRSFFRSNSAHFYFTI